MWVHNVPNHRLHIYFNTYRNIYTIFLLVSFRDVMTKFDQKGAVTKSEHNNNRVLTLDF